MGSAMSVPLDFHTIFLRDGLRSKMLLHRNWVVCAPFNTRRLGYEPNASKSEREGPTCYRSQ